MGRRRRNDQRPTHTAYRVACIAEACSRLSLILGCLVIAGLILGSPAIALYQYDQENEPTPNLTPDDILHYGSYLIPIMILVLGFAFLGPWIRRRKLELTPGFAGIDKMDRSNRRDQRLLGDIGQPAQPAAIGKVGRIVRHRSTEGRRLGIVYGNDRTASPTLRKKKRKHQKKHGRKRGFLHRIRRSLGFSRKSRSRAAWWRAWLRLS